MVFQDKHRYFLELMLAALLLSASGPVGRVATYHLSPIFVIFCRCFISCIVLFALLYILKKKIRISSKQEFRFFAVSGLFMCAHLVTYFFAIQYTGVAVAFVALFTFPVLTALLEPLLLNTKLKKQTLINAVLILVGIIVLSPHFDIKSNITIGILFGLISAICYSIRNILNKRNISDKDGLSIMFYQMLVTAIVLAPTVPFLYQPISATEYYAIFTLAIVVTVGGHTLFVRSLKFFDVSTASIIGSVQPVLGAWMAYAFLGEKIAINTMIGGGIILFTVFTESFSQLRK